MPVNPSHPDNGAIVVVGSLHYDIMLDAPARPRKGETVTGTRWHPKFGGKGGNQALAAAQAGAQTRFVGAVGQDDFATLMLTTLEAAGIGTDHVATIPDCGTGMSVAITDPQGDYGAVIVSGANLQINAAQFATPALWQGAKLLILQNEIPEAINIAAARAARAAGARVCLNAAPARRLSDELAGLVDILVVNALEAEDMTGRVVNSLPEAEDAAQHLGRSYATAIVTAGENGVAWVEPGQAPSSLPARTVKVVRTHGAGDMFIGTLCHALAQELPLKQAIRDANAAAARHISQAE